MCYEEPNISWELDSAIDNEDGERGTDDTGNLRRNVFRVISGCRLQRSQSSTWISGEEYHGTGVWGGFRRNLTRISGYAFVARQATTQVHK